MSKITIDGNIGCGKSAIITKLQEDPDIIDEFYVSEEPIYMWSEWLSCFYISPESNAFGLQMTVLKSHIKNKRCVQGIFERSPVSCHEVFAQTLYDDRILLEREFNLLDEFYYDFGWKPDITIYLECPPDVCLERIKSRDRGDENKITIEYLRKIGDKYNEVFYKDCNVIKVDATKSEDDLYEEVKTIILSKKALVARKIEEKLVEAIKDIAYMNRETIISLGLIDKLKRAIDDNVF